MNYLAHAILSFDEPGILAGNMISDFVKGNKKLDYPADVQLGIALHRAIDSYTDTHEATRAARTCFRPAYRLYAGAFTDVAFDHFLAKQLAVTTNLKEKTTGFYRQLDEQSHLFPPPFDSMFPHMKEHDWLYHYQFDWGMERSFRGLKRRAAYIEETETAMEIFHTHYHQLQQCFDDFWPLLHQYAFNLFEQFRDQSGSPTHNL